MPGSLASLKCKKRDDVHDVGNGFKRLQRSEQPGNSRGGKHRPGTLVKLLVEFLLGERPIRTAPVSLIGFLDEAPTVFKVHFHYASNLFKASSFDTGIENCRNFRHHLLDWSAANKLISKFVDARFAPDRDAGQHECGAELGLELARGDGISQWVQNIGSGAQANRTDLFGLHLVARDEPAHGIHTGVAKHAAGIGLDRHARIDDAERTPEAADDAIRFKSPAKAEDLEETP